MAETVPRFGPASWHRPNPGPLARAAVEAIGAPWYVAELRVEMSGPVTGNRMSVNGCPVPLRDATLVISAAACDPVLIGPEPNPWDIAFMKRAIIIRRLLNFEGEAA
ncbi:hypothetical protein [Methylobacterium sp. SD21]|uniref:hypothetical protein n=1 Tax=Methylobacterium litchii TaxID=3138810 RepID=UPI00313BFB71